MTDPILKMIKEVDQALRVSGSIPIMDIMEDEKTLITRESSVVRVIKLQGKDYSGLSFEEKRTLFEKRKGFFEGLGTDVRVSTHYHRVEYNIEERSYDMGNKWANQIAHLHDKDFTKAFRTDVYIVVSIPDRRLLKGNGMPQRNLAAETEYYEQVRDKLAAEVESLMGVLEDYSPHILEHTKDGKSPLLRFWMYILNGGEYPDLTPKQNHDLNDAMALADIEVVSKKRDNLFTRLNKVFEKNDLPSPVKEEINKEIKKTYDRTDADYIIVHNANRRRYTAFVAMKSYPDETDFHVFDGLMGCQKTFSVVQHVKMVNDETAKNLIETLQNRWKSLGRFSTRITADLEDANEHIMAENFRLAWHSMSVAIHGDTKEECEDGVRIVQQAFNAAQINSLRERFATEHTYWSQFPDYEAMNNPRGGYVSTITLADMVNFGAKHQGNMSCSFGDAPLTYFKTPDGQNYAFTYHPTPDKYVAGHTMVFGSTGSGKTVLMNFLMKCGLKYQGEGAEHPLKTLVFDSLRGMKIPVEAFGGEYIDFMRDDVALNPMQIKDTAENRAFLERWIAQLAGRTTEGDRNLIAQAIAVGFERLPQEQRSLHAIRDMFGIASFNDEATDSANIAARLAKWLPDPDDPTTSPYPNGMHFNSELDALSFNKRIVGFDMTSVLQNEELLAPLTSYIFHAFVQDIMENPGPHVCYMDEAIQYIENPFMYDFIEKFLREHRKLNGVFVGAVQSPALIMQSKKAEALLSHIKTYIIFQDSSAVQEDYCGSKSKKGLGLTESEFDWVRAKSKAGREVMVKRATGESVILNVDLSSLGDHLKLLRSEAGLVDKFENIQTQYERDLIKHDLDKLNGVNTPKPEPWQKQLMETDL